MRSKIALTWLNIVLISLFWGCSESTTQLPAPQKIGHNERSRTISGNRAAEAINKMHGQSVAADANAIVEYGRENKDILYISYYEDPNRAGDAFDLMIEKMAATKQGPFFHLMPLANYNNKAYFTLGMGARHYIFVSGNFLLWLQTHQSFGGELPSQLLDLYPLTSGPSGSRSA
jgi:hypothetical protein